MDSRASDSDPDDLARCFQTHAKGLYVYACVVTRGDRALAEDLVQEAFRAAAQDWPLLRCRSDDQLRAWLRTTVHHLAVSVFRRNDLARRTQAQVEARYQQPDADTYREALHAMALERCWQVIERMPERQHLIALLRWREGMKPSEIADALGIALGTVYAQLHGARRKLLAEIGPYGPFAQDDRSGPSVQDREGGATS